MVLSELDELPVGVGVGVSSCEGVTSLRLMVSVADPDVDEVLVIDEEPVNVDLRNVFVEVEVRDHDASLELVGVMVGEDVTDGSRPTRISYDSPLAQGISVVVCPHRQAVSVLVVVTHCCVLCKSS